MLCRAIKKKKKKTDSLTLLAIFSLATLARKRHYDHASAEKGIAQHPEYIGKTLPSPRYTVGLNQIL